MAGHLWHDQPLREGAGRRRDNKRDESPEAWPQLLQQIHPLIPPEVRKNESSAPNVRPHHQALAPPQPRRHDRLRTYPQLHGIRVPQLCRDLRHPTGRLDLPESPDRGALDVLLLRAHNNAEVSQTDDRVPRQC